ncbi:GNAT family N-acetyltransferase [Streptomyces sp. NRRL B-24720]|uniref:GNAT family N-acetyltransferase n=1 Tax=Streptomyces sp. NRRL B-24720 TaxID=1476876 RepID=UPI0004C888C8|nr:GNAT family N-acetyltransferase [Streptomyces sp. NRRL B-24720]
MSNRYLIRTDRVAIRHVCGDDYEEITTLTHDSTELHHPWVPRRGSTREAFDGFLDRIAQPTHEGLVICLRQTGAIVGGVNINNIVRGSMQSGMLGYVAYASTTGRGYMSEGLRLVIQFAFTDLGLHRLEANIQPENTASLKLVKRLGFRREGYSPGFQYINGTWQDHERWALTADTIPAPPQQATRR